MFERKNSLSFVKNKNLKNSLKPNFVLIKSIIKFSFDHVKTFCGQSIKRMEIKVFMFKKALLMPPTYLVDRKIYVM